MPGGGLPLPGKGKSSSAQQKAKGNPVPGPLEDPKSLELGPESEPVNSYSNPFLDNLKGDENIFDLEKEIHEDINEGLQTGADKIIESIENAAEDVEDWFTKLLKSIWNFIKSNWIWLALLLGGSFFVFIFAAKIFL